MDVDKDFYLDADRFFSKWAGEGLTYADISLATRHSSVLPSETHLETELSDQLKLSLPILSSDMDTVTEAKMAVAMALNGGLGILHYNMGEAAQLETLSNVKRHIHGFIQNPITVSAESCIQDVIALIEEKQLAFSTFPVVDEKHQLLGILPGQVIKERYRHYKVSEAMSPRKDLYTLYKEDIALNPIEAADSFFDAHMGIHKLLVVDKHDRLHGLFTLSDIEKIKLEHLSPFKSTRDASFRLACAVALALPRAKEGTLDKNALVTHVERLVEGHCDALALSTAHAFSDKVGEAVALLKEVFPNLTLIAGNVTSAEGVAFLAKAGADAVKVGQGPGSICTTRMVAGVGIPQMTALYVCAKAAKEHGMRLLADGGITQSGDIVKALTQANAVVLGSLLAGCKEAPGEILKISGKLYKQYRGMGSTAAMKQGSLSRYGHTKLEGKTAAEGIEALKEISTTVDKVLAQLAGGLQSGLGYVGAARLEELREKALFVRVSAAGQKESAPHSVVQVETPR